MKFGGLSRRFFPSFSFPSPPRGCEERNIKIRPFCPSTDEPLERGDAWMGDLHPVVLLDYENFPFYSFPPTTKNGDGWRMAGRYF